MQSTDREERDTIYSVSYSDHGEGTAGQRWSWGNQEKAGGFTLEPGGQGHPLGPCWSPKPNKTQTGVCRKERAYF